MKTIMTVVAVACAVQIAHAATNQVAGTSTLPPKKQVIVEAMRAAQVQKAEAISALPGVKEIDTRLEQLRAEILSLQERRRAIIAQNREALARIDESAMDAVKKLTTPADTAKPEATEPAP